LGPSQPLSRKPTQEPRDPETVVAHRVRRSAGLNQRPQPVTRSRMNHPAPPVEHDGQVHSGSGPHPTKPERSRGNHGSTLRAATDSEADVSTTKKNQPVTNNRGRCSMATDKQRQLRRMPPTPERRRRGAGDRRCRTERTAHQLSPEGGRPFGAGHRGRSTVVVGLSWWLAAADRQSRSNQMPGGVRRRQDKSWWCRWVVRGPG